MREVDLHTVFLMSNNLPYSKIVNNECWVYINQFIMQVEMNLDAFRR